MKEEAKPEKIEKNIKLPNGESKKIGANALPMKKGVKISDEEFLSKLEKAAKKGVFSQENGEAKNDDSNK